MNSIFIRNKTEQHWVEKARQLAEEFKVTSTEHDCNATFPFDHFARLKEEGFTKLTVKAEYGGSGFTLYPFLLVQEELAKGDGATALCLGWHNGLFLQLKETEKWEPAVFERLSKEAAQKGFLLNSAATEPKTGSPARGGRPETEAKRTKDGWIITGRKTFTSLAPALDYFIVTAWIQEKNAIGEFLIPKEAKGLVIKETWDTLGMRSTRSDDLILNQVLVSNEAFVSLKGMGKNVPQAWLLHIPAVYLGIAQAARDYAVQFATEYQPNSLPHPISEVPEVRRKVALMDLQLMNARHFLYHVASLWDSQDEVRLELGPTLMAVKTAVTNAAIEVVDLAMRVVGGHSLSKNAPLEKYYRDVRAGLHNPPSDDITYKVLGDQALNK
ncbi:acyl-CoA dehydrogenase family protein [Bacillus litorisediminis]|uniref:acyl-CoA dehydrogenase family protein n=1 Tax=Bacillus litorisediminis TaxID=2922713 RepID=UPI001FAF1196|nr:acyl-CoA dehydrogenase family protein [Bacillus litorisediminis]